MEKHRLSGLQGFLMGGNTPVAQIREGEISRILEPIFCPFISCMRKTPPCIPGSGTAAWIPAGPTPAFSARA